MIEISLSNAAREDGGPMPSATVLIQKAARIVSAGVSDITDSSGGTASAAKTIAAVATSFTNVADAGTTLADKTTTEAALNTVKDALLELATKGNSLATTLGIDTITYNGGGTAGDGTINAVTVAVTAAATGVQATELGATVTALVQAEADVANLVNRICVATGEQPMNVDVLPQPADTTAAITVAGGTAADPGVTKAAVDAALAAFANNVATMAARINATTGAYAHEYVVVP